MANDSFRLNITINDFHDVHEYNLFEYIVYNFMNPKLDSTYHFRFLNISLRTIIETKYIKRIPQFIALSPAMVMSLVWKLNFLFFMMIFLCMLIDFSYWTEINIIQDFKPVANCLKTHMSPALS